jgi:hypothetical protein
MQKTMLEKIGLKNSIMISFLKSRILRILRFLNAGFFRIFFLFFVNVLGQRMCQEILAGANKKISLFFR